MKPISLAIKTDLQFFFFTVSKSIEINNVCFMESPQMNIL